MNIQIARTGSELLVNSQVQGSQFDPAVAGLAGGGFVVIWTDASGALGDPSGNGVTAQVFTAGGARLGAEFQVNTSTASAQQAPNITALAGGAPMAPSTVAAPARAAGPRPGRCG